MGWTFVVSLPARGTHIAELGRARDRQVSFRLAEPSQASFSIDGTDPSATLIDELITDLVAYRDGEAVFRGRIVASGDDIDGEAARHEGTFAALDYAAILDRRLVYAADVLAWTSTEKADVAWSMVSATQARPGGALGITQGAAPPIGPIDHVNEPGVIIGQVIDEMGAREPHFDWEVGPDLTLDLWAGGRGVEKALVVEVGTTARRVRRTLDPGAWSNALRLSGAAGIPAVEVAAGNIANRPEGRWERQEGSDIPDAATLAARGDYLLTQAIDLRPTYEASLSRGRWRGPSTCWLGDWVRLVLASGRLAVNAYQRVQAITVTLDDAGNEDVSLTLSARPVGQRDIIRRLWRRVTDLERR